MVDGAGLLGVVDHEASCADVVAGAGRGWCRLMATATAPVDPSRSALGALRRHRAVGKLLLLAVAAAVFVP